MLQFKDNPVLVGYAWITFFEVGSAEPAQTVRSYFNALSQCFRWES